MTDEEKNDLLISLCSYYPYGVMVEVEGSGTSRLKGIDNGTASTERGNYPLTLVKPYLRPMDSMTMMEHKSYKNMLMIVFDDITYEAWDIEDWLNEKFIDYRGLISKGLALEAPEGMYNIKDEEKNDLLISLCGYYPYGVMVEVEGSGTSRLKGIDNGTASTERGNFPLMLVKPYLRPMDSMTGIEMLCYQNMSVYWFDKEKYKDAWEIEDWLNDSFLDYRNLISKGLALEAKEGMYKAFEEEYDK